MLAEPIVISNKGDPVKYTVCTLLALSTALLSGCSLLKVQSRADRNFDFNAVNTYEWVQAPKKILEEDDTLISKNVQIALNNQISARGWKQVLDTDQADIQIVYYIKLAEHQEYAGPENSAGEPRLTGGFTYNPGKGKWGYNDKQSDLNAYTIDVGTLTLLIYDTKSGEKVWSGTLETRLDRSTPVEKQKEMLSIIAQKIISRIP